jgi:hypothetical protein
MRSSLCAYQKDFAQYDGKARFARHSAHFFQNTAKAASFQQRGARFFLAAACYNAEKKEAKKWKLNWNKRTGRTAASIRGA